MSRHKIVWLLVCAAVTFAHAKLVADDKQRNTSFAGNEKVAEIIRSFQGRGVQSDGSTPTPADEAVKQFQMRSGFAIDLVAAEPAISQPLFLSWDSRGRLWVVQYRQYQYPAGLKVVRYDQHLRAVFDKVPEPPPRGPVGKDRITVFEDTDGDGLFDSYKDVITGLNIVSSAQVGHGGIWVLNPPYLLFYPDANGDDVPDSDPEVRLSGFGLQDTHSVSNSLLWGPDGWLYAVNGSTTVGTVRSDVTPDTHFMGQCVWRYHPDTRVFEIYAEGGGNTFSLDIDSKGRVFTGTNGGGTRGFYFPQGSYSHKNWGKHGPLTNPYAFGFFRQMESKGDNRRFPQAFMIYEGGLFPDEFDGSIIAPNAMHNLIWHSRRFAQGSTYRTEDDVNLVETPDRWFRPVYAGAGPDGGVYVADWYDTRLSHVSPIDDWHKASGRIYRIRPENTSPKYDAGDLAKAEPASLVKLFAHRNKWVRQRAALEIGWRGDKSIVPTLLHQIQSNASLEALWALNMLEELTTARAEEFLDHADPHIRRWTIRLLGDRHEACEKLADIAAREPVGQVRSQLASTAKRLPPGIALRIVKQLISQSERNGDDKDPHMPLMVWWALEAQCHDHDLISSFFSDTEIWNDTLAKSTITERIMQRFAAAGSSSDLEQCNRLLTLAPDNDSKDRLLTGFNRAFQGRTLPPLPEPLSSAFTNYLKSRGQSPIVLALKQQKFDAAKQAITAVNHQATDLGTRIEIARTLGQISVPESVDTLLRLATARDNNELALQRVAIQSLARYDDPRIANTLANAMGGQISEEHDLRATACRTLASRPAWAKRLLLELTEWRLKRSDIPPDVVLRLRSFPNPDISAKVDEVFGKPMTASSPETVETINRLTAVLSDANAPRGDHALGKVVFQKKCATCHRLFGDGEQIGPPLDAYDRGNLKFWLPAIVAPGMEIREGYQSYAATMIDGRVITGIIAEQNDKTVTLKTGDEQATIILDREEIESLQAVNASLMPNDLLKDVSEQQLRDLFAYLTLGSDLKGSVSTKAN
ncbi:MAG: c-type cytochrome [Planctomycetales bacterium]|nr:c-type cytochrome [Planctomycetales bacterium]